MYPPKTEQPPALLQAVVFEVVPAGIEPATQGFSVVHVWYRSVNYARTLITAKRKIRTLLYSRLIYMFIKVKSNKGKKMAAPRLIGFSHFFSFGCNSVEQLGTTKVQFSLAG